MRLRKLPRSFYLQPTLRIARELLGKYLIHQDRNQKLVGRIVETEAYLGEKDPASHAYRGITKRNEVMFREGGCLYVYFTYGMHFCANVVTEEEGKARAVLLRAVQPIEGIALMKRRRGIRANTIQELANGPANLCVSLGIARRHNGVDLCGGEMWIASEEKSNLPIHTSVSTRVGIKNGRRHKWRFFVRDSPFVSKGRPARV